MKKEEKKPVDWEGVLGWELLEASMQKKTRKEIVARLYTVALGMVDERQKTLTAQLSETEEKLKEAYEFIIGMVHNSCCRSYSKSLRHSDDCIVLEAQTWLEDKE